MQVDGESGYNAEVSNLFLFVWPTALFLWWLRKTMSKDGLTPNPSVEGTLRDKTAQRPSLPR